MDLKLKLPEKKDKTPKEGKGKTGEPRVNFTPVEALTRAKQRNDGKIGIVIAALLAGAVGTVYWMGIEPLSAAKDGLAEAESNGQIIQAKITRYAPVERVFAEVQALDDSVLAHTDGVIDQALVLERFLSVVSEYMDVNSVQLDTSGQGRCRISDDFFNTEIEFVGCIQFSGKGTPRAALDLPGILTADPWFVEPNISSLSLQQAAATGLLPISGTVGITPAILIPPETPTELPEGGFMNDVVDEVYEQPMQDFTQYISEETPIVESEPEVVSE